MPTHFEATSASLGCHPCPVGDSPAEPAAHLRQTFPPAVIGAGKVEAAGPGMSAFVHPPAEAVARAVAAAGLGLGLRLLRLGRRGEAGLSPYCTD